MRLTLREGYVARALQLGVEGAPPLEFRDVDVRDRPDNPEHKFRLVVEPGSIVAAIGDEDSGVGDLGRFALGLDRPPAGQVLAFGTAIADLPYDDQLLFRRRLGYLQAGDGLLQNLTLRANIALPLAYASDHRAREVQERVDELLRQFDLMDAAELRPAQANEEQRRQAAVARAVALDPELVVLEAPFDGLTGRAARALLDRVRHRADGTPRAVFITAQDVVPAIQSLLNRVVLVMEGRAVEGKNP
jgi:ABC-type transporter Mla maintaining outer membrane lipid asymmetry ATPase subunit MlaF